jgi:hypothetical protein
MRRRLDIGGKSHVAPSETGVFGIGAPGRPLRALEFRASGENAEPERENGQNFASMRHAAIRAAGALIGAEARWLTVQI